jgi:hypothetical protein
MKIEQLKIANESLKEIKELEWQIEILENAYINFIVGFDYTHDKEMGEKVSFSLDGELRDIVVKYKKDRLKKLQDDFENL